MLVGRHQHTCSPTPTLLFPDTNICSPTRVPRHQRDPTSWIIKYTSENSVGEIKIALLIYLVPVVIVKLLSPSRIDHHFLLEVVNVIVVGLSVDMQKDDPSNPVWQVLLWFLCRWNSAAEIIFLSEGYMFHSCGIKPGHKRMHLQKRVGCEGVKVWPCSNDTETGKKTWSLF